MYWRGLESLGEAERNAGRCTRRTARSKRFIGNSFFHYNLWPDCPCLVKEAIFFLLYTPAAFEGNKWNPKFERKFLRYVSDYIATTLLRYNRLHTSRISFRILGSTYCPQMQQACIIGKI